ncbi:MAG: PAS domain S-box protein [Chloroflexota bacterium]
MREPTRGTATALRTVPSPVDAIPSLADLAGLVADPIVVTDLAARIVIWNHATARLYGIDAAEALGRTPEDLLLSSIVGSGADRTIAREQAIREGHWSGRIVDIPRDGAKPGKVLTVEAVLSRLDDAGGRAVGVLSIIRDVTGAVRLEAELATLGWLATTTESAGSRADIAEGVLNVLIRSTDATAGFVLAAVDDGLVVLAMHGVPERLVGLIQHGPLSSSPLAAAIRAPGSIVSGPIAEVPLFASNREALKAAGIEAIVVVGLHRHDDLAGAVILYYDREDAPRPSNAALIQVGVHVQRALDNASLIDEIQARAEAERRLLDQHLAVQSLTQLSESSDDFGVLAQRTVEQVTVALGGSAGSYTLISAEGGGVGWVSWAVPAQFKDRIRALSQDPQTPLRRFAAGEGPFFQAFEPGGVARPESLELARQIGWSGYAALPILIDGRLEGVLIVYFGRPLDELAIEPRVLEAMARTASISLANFRLRERLIASERRYRTLFHESPDALLVASLEGTILDANAAATETYGADETWLSAHSTADLSVMDEDLVHDRVAELELGEQLAFRSIGRRADGTSFPQEIEMARVALDGEPRILVRSRDLTEQERLQQELVQAQKMEATGQLVSGVAHELNNPLAAILGFSQLIRRDGRLPEDLRHNADLLVEEATRTRRIVQNLLDFARQRAPERYPTSIRGLVDSVLLLQSYSLGPGRIEVQTDLPSDLPLVELDRSQIQQVLVNLTQNAIHAIRQVGGGGLRISARLEGSPDDGRVRIAVSDDGIGVPAEHVDRLFVPFFTTKPPTEGTGLGLPVSYGIVAAHGGELTYRPEPGGRGSTFAFDLPVRGSLPAAGAPVEPLAGGAKRSIIEPRAMTVPPHHPAPEITPRPSRRCRILVLDDERSLRLLLEKYIRGAGYEPVVATTGEEAVRLVETSEIDAILCDHRMAGMSGTEVYDAVVHARPHLSRRFVFMSGDVLNPSLRDFARDHGVALLAKPFDLDTIGRTLRTVLPTDGLGQAPRG